MKQVRNMFLAFISVMLISCVGNSNSNSSSSSPAQAAEAKSNTLKSTKLVSDVSTNLGILNYQIFHSFNFDDGALPYAGLIQASDGNFYGTTAYGGDKNYGTVFRITESGVENVIYAFTGDNDGATPLTALVQANDGNFYGTTTYGGGTGCTGGCGTVFKITPTGVKSVIHIFTGKPDGGNPNANLIQARDGNLYGTTLKGGTNDFGSVFRITEFGVESIIYSFNGSPDGAGPNALIQASDGNLYGTTQYGGGSGAYGTIFRLTESGFLTVLHSFIGGNDGEIPYAGLIQASDGNFYGTTSSGGGTGCLGSYGCGTVFKITPDGVMSIIHKFNDTPDGASPFAGLIQASDGNFYGTTSSGGGAGCTGSSGCGAVFKITPAGVESVIHLFTGKPDGESPRNLIQALDGNVYGTTVLGGTSSSGAIFKIKLH